MWSNKEIVEYRLQISEDCFNTLNNTEKIKNENFIYFGSYFIINKHNITAIDVSRDIKLHKTVVQIFTNIDRVYFLNCKNDKLAIEVFEYLQKQL